MTLRKHTRLLAAIAAICTSVFISSPSSAQKAEENMEELLRENFDIAARQYTQLLDTLKASGAWESDRPFPHSIRDGQLFCVRDTGWTSGFFPGSLWYLYEYTGDAKWRDAARAYTARLEKIKDFTGHHDIGFMLYCSYGNGYRLTRDAAYRDVLLQGSRSLASRFNPYAGVIRSWSSGQWTHPVIIDNMMNLELLNWATRESADPRYREISIRHAQTTLANHFRDDGSSFHLVDYDPSTGAIIRRHTAQGYANWSAWARGQAWGLYGFTLMYRDTRNPAYLEQAKKIAFFLLNHNRLPADKVPYWDFDAPDIPNAPRDASSAAIMASALIELSDYVDAKLSKWYLDTARRQLLSLSSPAYRAKAGENGGFILMHSVTHFPKNSEVDVPLNYADYYFLEALLRYRVKMSGQPVVSQPTEPPDAADGNAPRAKNGKSKQ